MNVLSVNYIMWLIFSALFFAAGEFLSKKFALHPTTTLVVIIVVTYSVGVLLWLPAILQKNQLSIVGTMWSVLSLLTTILIGVLVFKENVSLMGFLGIIFAFLSIVLLSMG